MVGLGIMCYILIQLFYRIESPDISPQILLAKFRECSRSASIPISPESIVDPISNPTLFEQLNYQWNLRVPKALPLAYFIPTTSTEVQQAVKCGRQVNVIIIPKSGGHSFESFSFGNPTTLILDFRRMYKIHISRDNKTATIESGALLRHVHETLWNYGGLGIPMGTHPTVGLGGLALGGGMGLYSNKLGLTIDNIVEMKMVDSTGDIHTVNQFVNPDLFWALRGVGPGYIGIVTDFKIKTFKPSDFSITYVQIKYDLGQITQFLESWQNWLTWCGEKNPDLLSWTWAGNDGISLILMRVQDTHQGLIVFESAYRQIFSKSINIRTANLDHNTAFAAEFDYFEWKNTSMPDDPPAQTTPISPVYFKRKSFLVEKIFNVNELERVGDVIRSVPKHTGLAIESKLGSIHSVPPNSTAYVHRKAIYQIEAMYVNSENDEDGMKKGLNWIQEFLKVTKFMDNGGTYQNYVEGDLTDYMERYYGTNAQRLIEIKTKWDESNYFRDVQSIPILKHN